MKKFTLISHVLLPPALFPIWACLLIFVHLPMGKCLWIGLLPSVINYYSDTSTIYEGEYFYRFPKFKCELFYRIYRLNGHLDTVCNTYVASETFNQNHKIICPWTNINTFAILHVMFYSLYIIRISTKKKY